MTSRIQALLLFAASGLAAGCGAGVAAVAATSGGSSGGTTPALSAFTVPNPKVSPARITLEASTSMQVELQYSVAGGPDLSMSLVPAAGVSGNRVDLAPGANEFTWAFAGDLGGEGLTRDVTLRVRRGGALIQGGELALFGMGNDAPVVLSVQPLPSDPSAPEESSGIVELRILLADSSSDLVDLTVEWRRESDPLDAWNAASFAGAPPGGVETNELGREFSFFWNTNLDLDDEEAAVFFRVTPDDRTDVGEPFLTERTQPAFRVDNNAAPIVQLFNDAVISNPDERRGIPVPFRVIDEEGDRVEVIFQWRREGEEFPPLLESEIDAVLADPFLRREKHICTEYPRFASGLVVPIDATTVRLPELARGESWILASGLVGRTLELLRPSSTLEPITPTWASNPLVSPIAALPVADGLTALVLDAPGNGRLREIELATGAIVREIATFGPGAPSAMAFERGEQAVLVATDLSGVWRIERVELASGAITELMVSDGSHPGPVRGLASLGTNAAVFTAGSALFSLDYRDPLAPQLGTLLSGLATPWGVVVDPLPPGRLYLAEREAVVAAGTGRVLAVELDSHEELPVVVRTDDLQPAHLERPSALALERHGSRMLIVTNEPGGASQLVGLDLGAQGRNVSFPIGPPRASGIASIASGPEELRCAALPGEHELLIGGGLESRRTIVAHENTGQAATLDAALQPETLPGRRWRIQTKPIPLPASATGREAVFLWSAETDIRGGSAILRALPRDDELGVATDGRASKRVRSSLDVAPLVLGSLTTTFQPVSLAVADLDGDGDRDLVSANFRSDSLTVFFQVDPGSFSSPLILATANPRAVAAADLDGDGDQDLVSANSMLTVFFQVSPGSFDPTPLVLGGAGRAVAAADLDADGDQDLVGANDSGLTVFFQTASGNFDPTPLVLGSSGSTNAVSVAVADLDGDGDQDLVSANDTAHSLTVFFQRSPGSFELAPLVLGGIGTTSLPRSVATADLDGDGDQDLVSANAQGSNLIVFFQTSPRNFHQALELGDLATTDTPVSVATADLDGDGDQDLVSASINGDNLTVFFQGSPGSFSSAPLVLGGPSTTDGPFGVAAVDLDGDGDQDLVSANTFGSNLTVFLQSSPGSLDPSALVLGDSGATKGPVSVAAADLDGDGDQDLVSANARGPNLTVFFQASPASIDPTPLVQGGSGTAPADVTAADLDGDGDQDLVSANSNLTVFFQRSPGSFDPTPFGLDGSGSPVSVAAADLDGDGDQDLVSCSNTRNQLAVFFQNLAGSFDRTLLGIRDFGAVSVTTADLDGDGDQDIAYANESGNRLGVFFQGSPGFFGPNFQEIGDPRTTLRPLRVEAADLDGDGDQDLVSVTSNPFIPSVKNLTVFLQSSPGSFDPSPLVLNTPHFPTFVEAADLDGDGDQDLVSASTTSNNLTVLLQDTPARFGSVPLVLGGLSTTFGPSFVTATDLDGDGDQDLVSANASGNTLTVFWGGR